MEEKINAEIVEICVIKSDTKKLETRTNAYV